MSSKLLRILLRMLIKKNFYMLKKKDVPWDKYLVVLERNEKIAVVNRG